MNITPRPRPVSPSSQPSSPVSLFRRTVTSLLVFSSAHAAFAASYYVDSSAGNDANAGTSSAAAWKSLTKVNAHTYVAGDKILFKAGGIWTGQLIPKGSGASGNPIVIDLYGSGAKPLIQANATKHNTVYLLNQSYWEINNLEVTNNAGSSASNLGDYRGISINGQDFGTINHVYIKNCNVHDVTGEVNWISGDTANNSTGVTFATGWDASKLTGGIVFATLSSTSTKTKFNDVLVQGCTVQKCSFGGIVFKQWDGSVHWGVRSSASDTNWTPHTNVTIKDNYINQSGSSYACNGIYLTDTKTATIENNVVANAGTCGIECYYCDAVTIQKNETYGTVKKASGADYNGIDPDKGTTNIIVQFNYSHDNGDGILLCQFSFGSATVRYNILQNNSRYGIYLHSDSKSPASIYNNVVYTNKSASELVYGYGSSLAAAYQFRNNIFYSSVSGPALTTGGGITYDYNSYSGVTAPSDGNKITSNPLLVSPGTGGTGSSSGTAFGTLGGYKLQSGSPCREQGTAISSNGGVDFWGTALYHGTADIGADEF